MNRVFHLLMELGKVLLFFANTAFVLLAFAVPIQHMLLNYWFGGKSFLADITFETFCQDVYLLYMTV